MSVYRDFDRNDIMFSTVHARPRVIVRYDENGWSGNTGPSASLSLYGGVRARSDVRSSDFSTSGLSVYPLDPLDTHSIDKVLYVSGSYPSTGSIRYVRCFDEQFASFTDVDETHWYDEHFSSIRGLFDYYSRFDTNYFLGNYDFYNVLLLAETALTSSVSGAYFYPGSYFAFSGAFSGTAITGPTKSFTAEAWIKPLPTSLSLTSPFPNIPTIMSQRDNWKFGVNENGTLFFSSEYPDSASYSDASTNSVTAGEWNHVAVVIENGSTASFWINGVNGGTSLFTDCLLSTGSEDHPLLVGAYECQTQLTSSRQHGFSLNGFVFETRVWNRILSENEIRTFSSGTLFASSSQGLLHYARFNDGPLSTAHSVIAGSGAFDYGPNARHGYVIPWSDDHVAHWQPNDHPTFITSATKVNQSIDEIRVIHAPSMFYGRQIDPGSVKISDGMYNSTGIVRVFNDDGRGGLYVSGSMTRKISDEEYTGEKRRKIGNVFYTEGLIVITDPALRDMMDSTSRFWDIEPSRSGTFNDLIEIDFRGQTRVHTKTFNCRMQTAQVNASNNPTFSELEFENPGVDEDIRKMVVRNDGVTYITAIGLYNEDRQLVAVAKLAQPIRKREKDKLNIRLKLDI